MIPRSPDELVQAILVSQAGTHENTVRATALASVQAWLTSPDDPAWNIWLSQPFAKTVRRVKPPKMSLLPDPRATVTVEDSTALAYAPLSYDQFPSELARAQVQGTDFPRREWPILTAAPASAPLLVLNPDVANIMSTGKTAAQAAHALMGYLLTLPMSERTVPDRVNVVVAATTADFDATCRDAAVVIRDHGRTEIEPDTATFAVL